MPTMDRRSYDTAASAEAEANLQAVIARLESVLAQRDADVKAAMADFFADGVSDLYQEKEIQWQRAGGEVETIITLLRRTLEENDATAAQSMQRARAAVAAVGG